MTHKSYESGLAGEDAALRYLTDRGYRLKARRYRAAGGEIDLIVKDGATLVFVEVKARPHMRLGEAKEAMDGRKVARMKAAARAYLNDHPHTGYRFDLIEITRAGLWHMKDCLIDG